LGGANISIEGLEDFRDDLGQIDASILDSIEEGIAWLRDAVVNRTPTDTGYAQSSWGEIERHSNGFSFSNPVEYMSVLEKGLYPGLGPKTVIFQGGIYSSQAPGGIIAPLINDDKILGHVSDLILNGILSNVRKRQ